MGFDPNKEDQSMARKWFKPEETVAMLQQVEVLQSLGMSAAGATRHTGMTEGEA